MIKLIWKSSEKKRALSVFGLKRWFGLRPRSRLRALPVSPETKIKCSLARLRPILGNTRKKESKRKSKSEKKAALCEVNKCFYAL